ncbi:isocitrate lyase/PEP mutase family protein [Marinobacterium lutimaris]|uniref:Carboxyvinyl-carboxyphosphonate phosphorylmutase n=1 Tax=Marinobacterium lutimaris TaxID=568106 RepID=A0A1H6AQ58_9GAMM|nr:isocitrate lyase/phosphoenolpyruvate mutase family protein [Marinobacterium lutimaris]SEG50848.1 carboxyvinyl-carboxyphosphonate phosphorylmutase [Marinobacterium lutimaris]
MSSAARMRLRELLETQQCVRCASVFDPLSSRMADDIGFSVGILGGSVTSLMALGVPDIYLLTLSELAEQARRVCQASGLPVIVDGDNGYGNSLNVMRTVSELEHAGASVITLEDTIIPRPYKQPELNLSSIEEGCSKLNAALRARRDPNLAIVARTHAQQPLESILERVGAYSHTGVDGICIFGKTSKALLEQLRSATDLPLMLIDYNKPEMSLEEMTQLGVRIHFNGHKAYEDAVKATYTSLLELHTGAESGSDIGSEQNAKQLISRFAGQQEFKALSEDYLGPV